ncbi:UDP-glucuronosyltransferase 2C1-like [Lytechinus variegatus]|uniref:UDP-glucuronosyltransferase 2C1-like n=1 Tax=Lytechinus variegatus TaxID=7654 RepID=UPI001BB11045|nr:UDP-glucuronosyltransferase 2C1-like [Lytechinus variegatus]
MNIQRGLMLMVSLVASISPSLGAKILCAMSSVINTPSQHIVMSAVTEPLVEAGHQVVLLAPKNKITKGLSTGAVTDKIFFESSRTKAEHEEFMNNLTGVQHQLSQSNPIAVFQLFRQHLHLLGEGCSNLFEDRATLDSLKKANFDLILTMPIVGCDALLAEYLKIPFILISPARRSLVVTEDHFGIPVPSSYVPFSIISSFTQSDRMPFKDRLQNILIRCVAQPLIEFITTYRLREIKKQMNIRPDLTLRQLMGRAELAFVYLSFALDYPQPLAPNWISIGGITAKPSQPLTKNLEEFVEGSGEHGFIIFTLGSAVTSLQNEGLAESIAKIFSELPQRVLWRYKGRRPDNVGNNTLISDWLPQNDLLGHPKARMMIYHGGAAGVYEATTHGVPLLLMPLAADQMGNAARVEAKGFGRAVDKNTLTEEEFREAVNDILTNPKYRTNAARASAIMKDQLASPQETVVYWVEHVLKFGGGHLRSRALELNFLQRESIDVVLFLLLVFLMVIFTVRWVVCSCCCRLCARRNTKSKKD